MSPCQSSMFSKWLSSSAKVGSSSSFDSARRMSASKRWFGSSIKVVIAAATDGSFDYVGIGVGNTDVVAVAR